MCPEYGGIHNSGTSGTLPVGVVMCAWTIEHDEDAFMDLSVVVRWQKRLA